MDSGEIENDALHILKLPDRSAGRAPFALFPAGETR
jgi:hypothetical protein